MSQPRSVPALDRVAWIGNLGGVGFHYVRVLNSQGQPADLYLPRSYYGKLRQGNPEHEWPGASQLPFLKTYWRNALSHGLNRMGILGPAMGFERHIARHYSLVQAQTCNEIAALRIKRLNGIRYVAMATGSDLSEVAVGDSPLGELYRRSLQEAEHLFLVNIDQFDTMDRLGLPVKSMGFLPFAIDLERLPAVENRVTGELRLFNAARLDWRSESRASTKANDVFFRGLANFVARHPDRRVRVAIADWGPDRELARGFVRDLGLEGISEFVPFGDKSVFQCQVKQANVVIDQFKLGATGLTAVEAMAMGRPVMAFCDRRLARRGYGEDIPVLNCANEADVSSCLEALDASAVAAKSREVAAWVRRMHSPERINGLLMDVYRGIV